MKKKIKISPSLMCADLSQLGEEVKKLEEAGADSFHFDIMDNKFVPNITFGPDIVESLREKTFLPFEIHMMVYQPENLIEKFIKAGGNIIIVHYEAVLYPYRILNELKNKNIKTGIAINPKTPVCCIEELIKEIDTVLVMCVEPGFAGGNFIPSSIKKIKEIKNIAEKVNSDLSIEVDGGVNEKTIPLLIKEGADIFVLGSTSIFREERDYKKRIKDIRKLIEKYL
ncbi:MAG TPA: ribulose-phosphate 3-epimerase [bacterium]|nr:ribulose-phosphate 3-epimerase [bacterium]HOM25884.1 ribulose-phosphate 3-epimerase [bacterium]